MQKGADQEMWPKDRSMFLISNYYSIMLNVFVQMIFHPCGQVLRPVSAYEPYVIKLSEKKNDPLLQGIISEILRAQRITRSPRTGMVSELMRLLGPEQLTAAIGCPMEFTIGAAMQTRPYSSSSRSRA